MTDPTTERTLYDVITDELKLARKTRADVHRAVIADGGEWVSYSFVAKICRGGDDDGPMADRIRTQIENLTGKSIAAMRESLNSSGEENGNRNGTGGGDPSPSRVPGS